MTDTAALRERLHQATNDTFLPTVLEWKDHQKTCRPLVEQMADEGLFALQLGIDGAPHPDTAPTESTGYSTILCVIRELFGYYHPLLDLTFALQGLGTGAIVGMGSENIKQRYLPDLVQGTKLFAFALSEPHCASDVLGLRTTAERAGDDWILNGQKMFISGAPDADVYVVFARSDGRERGKGITAFVIEKGTPGFEPRDGLELSAPHPMGYIDLTDCRIPDSQRIGAVDEGLKAALGTLETYRPSVGAYAIGLGRRAIDLAVAFGQGRNSFGAGLLEHSGIRVKLGRMIAHMAAGHALVRAAAALADAATPSSMLASAAKLYGTETATQAIYDSQQIHGGRGVLAGQEIENLARNVRGTTIYEGTTEVQKRIIGRVERQRTGAAPTPEASEPLLRWTRQTYERWRTWLAGSSAAMDDDAVLDRIADVALRLLAGEALAAHVDTQDADLHATALTAVSSEAALELVQAVLATVPATTTRSLDTFDTADLITGWQQAAATTSAGHDELLRHVADLHLRASEASR